MSTSCLPLGFGAATVGGPRAPAITLVTSATGSGPESLREGNVFEPTTDTGPMTLIGPPYGYIKNVENGLLGGASLLENEPQKVFSPSTHYAYKPDPADAALKARVAAGAGPR